MDACKLSNYIVLKSFNDNGRSLLDCLMPFIEYAIAENKNEYINVDELKELIKRECLIDIPLVTIVTLLRRLKKDNKITEYERWTIIRRVDNYILSSNSYDEKLRDFSRDIKQFISHCKSFCLFTDSDDEISNKLYDFINFYQHNINTQEGKIIKEEALTNDYKKLAEFIENISINNKDDYTTFKNIFYGFILAQFITKGGNIDKKNINNITIYIDTDFLLRVLDMQSPYFTLTSNELLILLHNYDFTIIVLPEIIDEVRNVLCYNLSKFINEGDKLRELYGSKIGNLDGVIGAFFRRNMNVSQIDEYISKVEEEVKILNINISPSEIPSIIEIREKDINKIIEYKLKSNRIDYIVNDHEKELAIENIKEKSLLDAKLINFIRYKRRKTIYRFQDTRYLLLSCDNAICKVSNSYHDHNNTIAECFNEESLTNILFISNPTQIGEMPIKILLSLINSSKYLNYDILCQFHIGVRKYIDQNPDDQQYLASVFRNQKLFSELNGCYDLGNDESASDTDFIKLLFDNAKNEAEEEKNKSDNIAEENKKLKNEIDELKKLTEKNPFEKNNRKNEKAEQLLNYSINVGFILFIILYIIFFILKSSFNQFSFTLEYFSKISIYISPLIFLIVFYIHLNDDKEKLINRIIYEKKNESLLNILFIALFKTIIITLTSFVIPVISLIIEIFNNKGGN
jgi:hypothetical protein